MRAWRAIPSTVSTGSRSTVRKYWRTTSPQSTTAQQRRGTLLHLVQRGQDDEELTGEIEVEGYVRSIRKYKRIAFAALGDGSTTIPVQAVLQPEHADLYLVTRSQCKTE